jgi:hypothetical protein
MSLAQSLPRHRRNREPGRRPADTLHELAEKATRMASDGSQATLARPGAGLPKFGTFVLGRVVFPACCWVTSWEKAAAVFEVEAEKLIALARPLPSDLSQKRVLIKPLWGIEGSSRSWSAEMVLEHLIEVSTRTAIRIVELSHGEKPAIEADTAGVEPTGDQGFIVLEDFIAFLDDYTQTLSEDVGDRRSKLTHPHPWFGLLTAHRWACLSAVHLTVHRWQMERIVAGLQSGTDAGSE